MHCPNGHLQIAEYQFCPTCGVRVSGLRENEPERGKSYLLVGWLVLGTVVAGLVLWSFLGDDSEPEGATAAVPTTSPAQRCFDETIDWLNEAVDARRLGDESAFLRRYGLQDPRTQELLRIDRTFQSDILQIGEERANEAASLNIEDYCRLYPDG